MTARLSSKQRRLQLVRAALQLLADHPVDQLTTRRLAEAVGLTQPALFRHFTSKEALLDAVVAYLCRNLEELLAKLEEARAALGEGRRGLGALEEVLAALFAFAEQHPGALRLLFLDVAEASAGGDLGEPLRRRLAEQASLVTGLVALAVERGELPAGLDAVRAGELLSASFQGELLTWHLATGPKPPLVPRAAAIAEHFWAGLVGGAPQRTDSVAAGSLGEQLLLFDACPILTGGGDPFDEIHAAHGRLAEGGALAVLAPFRPQPLIGLFEGRGQRVDCVELSGDLHLTVIRAGGLLLDLSELPAPEPMEALLLAAAELAPGEHLFARLPRFPRLLLPRLEERGLAWHAVELPDSSSLLHLVLADSTAGAPR
ncbi:MAG: TetR/AcrR family transcriptional regulator [Planctomycetota bacterium]|nr:TetR/AcrR family transcriptional regulator [Planctomycetota bacterium]